MDKLFDKKIGIVGCGHMGSAIIQGMLESDLCKADNILASAAHEKDVCGVACGTDNRKVASTADILIMAVRPGDFEFIAAEIKDSIKDDATVVSVAAFISLDDMKNVFGVI